MQVLPSHVMPVVSLVIFFLVLQFLLFILISNSLLVSPVIPLSNGNTKFLLMDLNCIGLVVRMCGEITINVGWLPIHGMMKAVIFVFRYEDAQNWQDVFLF